ncbi:MAG: GIY-YIG nuclease family protein [Candidatus Saccharimonadales bacterium]
MYTYYVYILASKPNGTLYVGVTNNLERRLFEHKHELADGFTKKYGVKTLVYYEESTSIGAAITREKQLKKWERAWKVRLIEEGNPYWKDLSLEWGTDSRLRGNDSDVVKVQV